MINLIKRKKNNNIPFVWVIILLVVIFFVVRNYYNIYDLRKNGIHIKGFLYEVKGVGSKGIIRGFYRFKVDTRTFKGFYDNDKLVKYDSIDIIYHRHNPELNQAKQFVNDY